MLRGGNGEPWYYCVFYLQKGFAEWGKEKEMVFVKVGGSQVLYEEVKNALDIGNWKLGAGSKWIMRKNGEM